MSQTGDEILPLIRAQLAQRHAVRGARCDVGSEQCAAVKGQIGWWNIEVANDQQRIRSGRRQLVVDVVRQPGIGRTREQDLAERVQGTDFAFRQDPERHLPGSRFARRQQHFDTADREGQPNGPVSATRSTLTDDGFFTQ